MRFQTFHKLQNELLAQATTMRQNMGLYKSSRVKMVEKFLQKYGEKRPIAVSDILPVILMNYGEVEFQKAQTWVRGGQFGHRNLIHRIEAKVV